MPDCIFCKIIEGGLPSYKIYEDEKFLAFLDIMPENKGHTLVIPKIHYHWVYDVPEFDKYWLVALKITKAIQKALSPFYISYQTFGIQVPHAHIHIKPRYEESEEILQESRRFTKEELSKIAIKLRSSL